MEKRRKVRKKTRANRRDKNRRRIEQERGKERKK